MTEIDDIELAAAAAEAETGARGMAAKVPLCLSATEKQASRRWTEEEEAYVRANHGRLSDEEIAANLGRTVASIDNHIKREMHLVAPSKSPEIFTAEQVAWGLGISCGKSIARLMDLGFMPHRRLPGKDVTRVIDRRVLLLWMLEPRHWVYFKPERVGAVASRGKRQLADCYDFKFWEEARELMLEARAKWNDEWLTPRKAAMALGFKNLRTGIHSINTAIHVGTLAATRRGNWWIRRSALPPADMTINVFGKIVPKVKPKYACPRGMAHPNPSTCMKLRFCRELMTTKEVS